MATKEKPRAHRMRCAIYTRKSSEEGLELDFNSLDAQREACEDYIKSQRHEGWEASPLVVKKLVAFPRRLDKMRIPIGQVI